MMIVQKPVKNYWQGRGGYRPEAVVIHIAEGTLPGGYSWFNNPDSQASSHYMVGKDGQIWQFVQEQDTAWHAGGVNRPNWSKLKDGVNPNLYTIGIEHEGFTGDQFTDEMYEGTSFLLAEIAKRWNIPLDRTHVIGHNQINSVSRSRCPGKGVDLGKLINLAKSKIEDPRMIAELQEKITQLERSLQNAREENELLRSAVSRFENDMRGLREAYHEQGQRVRDLEKQLELVSEAENVDTTLLQENTTLRKQVVSLQQNITRLNQQLVNTTNKPQSFWDRLRNLFG